MSKRSGAVAWYSPTLWSATTACGNCATGCAPRPPSETYYERIDLGRRVEAALAERRGSEANAILEELLPLAERVAELRLHEDDMIFNRAFLVRRDMEPRFDAALQSLADRFTDRMDFRYVGPVPPFNFVTLQAGWLTAPAVQTQAGFNARHGSRLMGAVANLLGLPVAGAPVGAGLARTPHCRGGGRREMNNPAHIEAELLALERRLEAGEIDEAAYEAREATLLEALQALTKRPGPARRNTTGRDRAMTVAERALTVAAARPEDASRGIARLDPADIAALGAETGGPAAHCRQPLHLCARIAGTPRRQGPRHAAGGRQYPP